jgi:hypothetical protein
LFLHEDGRILPPTARHIWDQLLSQDVVVTGSSPQSSDHMLPRLSAIAEEHAQPVYAELVRLHRQRLDRERQKSEYAYEVRRKAAGRIGLPAVRAHRIAELDAEHVSWMRELARKATVDPELIPIVVAHVG